MINLSVQLLCSSLREAEEAQASWDAQQRVSARAEQGTKRVRWDSGHQPGGNQEAAAGDHTLMEQDRGHGTSPVIPVVRCKRRRTGR